MEQLWNIMVLNCGHTVRESAQFTGGLNAGKPHQLQFWCCAVWNDEHKIVVDTALREEDEHPWYTTVPNVVDDEHRLVNQLKTQLGWEPEDVDIVINTHLHYDHTGQNYRFRNAKFYVQRAEWEFACDPHPNFAVAYNPKNFDGDAVPYFNWVFVDGEAQILPGLILIPTPGHTAGHQSVLVRTSAGAVCIAGDAVNCVAALDGDLKAAGTMSNLDQHNTNRKLKRIADYLISGHDEPSDEQFDHQTSGFHPVKR